MIEKKGDAEPFLPSSLLIPARHSSAILHAVEQDAVQSVEGLRSELKSPGGKSS